LRRQRRALHAVGSGFVLSAGLGLFVVAGGMNQQPTDVVPASPAVVKPTPGPAEDKAPAAAADMRRANNRLLLDALGKDWAATDDGEPFGAELVRGTASDQGLPDEFAVVAGIGVLGKGSNVTLAQLCAPMVEKGLHTGSCTPVDTDNGTVYLQRSYSVPAEWKPAGDRAGIGYLAATAVYLERVDHSLVRVQMVARGASTATEAGEKSATSWLGNYDQTLEKVAADRRVQPQADSAKGSSVPVSDHDRDQAILQKALGGSFTLGKGTVDLEPGSQKAAELPSAYYGATAELSKISAAAFHAACDARAGLTACETKTLDDGTVLHLRSWADRDAGDSEMRGESAVYLERKDGSVLLANLEATGRNVSAAQADKHAAVLRDWLDSLQSALVTAITDPGVVGTPAAS
jgi:hypothetical protein